MMHPPLAEVVSVYKCQLFAALIALLVVAVFFPHALTITSFCLGEAVMIIANGFLTLQVMRQKKKLLPFPLLARFLGGEIGKYALIILLTFCIAKYVVSLNWLFYAIGIAVPQLCGLICYFIRSQYR